MKCASFLKTASRQKWPKPSDKSVTHTLLLTCKATAAAAPMKCCNNLKRYNVEALETYKNKPSGVFGTTAQRLHVSGFYVLTFQRFNYLPFYDSTLHSPFALSSAQLLVKFCV